MPEPDLKTILAAVVVECRAELRLNHPDHRRVGLMLTDAVAALNDSLPERAASTPLEIEIHTPAGPELRVRGKAKRQKEV